MYTKKEIDKLNQDYEDLCKNLWISIPSFGESTEDTRYQYDPDDIHLGTVLEVNFWYNKLKIRTVFVSKIVSDKGSEYTMYKVNWMNDKNKINEELISPEMIVNKLADVPYETLGKGFYKFKWKIIFNPKFDITNSEFKINDFLNDAKPVKIINENTMEIDKKKFNKKHTWLLF